MLKTNTNHEIRTIYKELQVGKSIDLEFNGKRFTFTSELINDINWPVLIVQMEHINFGELVVNDNLTGFWYKDYDEDFKVEVNDLEQLYGLSLLKKWQQKIDLYE